MADVTQTYGAYTALTTTNLASLASSATAGWQSARIDFTAINAGDYEFVVQIPMANTAPANDRAIYVFVSPAVYTGSVWIHADGGTTTMPSGTQGTYSIAGTTTTNNLDLLRALAYTTQNQTVQAVMRLSDLYDTMPDGCSLIIVNYSGAATGSGPVVAYRPIAQAVA
jgi:hypothetical protein